MQSSGIVSGCGGRRRGSQLRREQRRQRRSGGGECGPSNWHIIIGAVLVLGGIAMLLDRTGLVDLGVVWRYWPLIPIAVGSVGLAFSRPGERAGGFWVLVGGLYCAIGVWNLFGLSWATAWPIFLVAGGLQMLADMLGGAPEQDQERKADDVQ